MTLHEEHITDESARRCRCTTCCVWWCGNVPGYSLCRECGEIVMKYFLVNGICPECKELQK